MNFDFFCVCRTYADQPPSPSLYYLHSYNECLVSIETNATKNILDIDHIFF